MTLEIHRPLPHQYESSSGRTTNMTNIKTAGASSIVRMPLQSRNPNTIGPLGSFNNSHHSSNEEYNSKDLGTLSRSRLSNLESSNNENNKRLTNSSSHGNLRRDSSHSDVREAAEPQKTPTRSSSVPRPRTPQRISALPPAAVADEDTVIIEEKRRKVNGEGFTMHRYLRGRLLGKGGFAKVYLCTALDTNKSYAIKIVPKANLVKTRARQKVRFTFSVQCGGLVWSGLVWSGLVLEEGNLFSDSTPRACSTNNTSSSSSSLSTHTHTHFHFISCKQRSKSTEH
jgi:hypothetical protein